MSDEKKTMRAELVYGSVPPDVIEAALHVGRWFAARDIQGWALGPCADRWAQPKPAPVLLTDDGWQPIESAPKTGQKILLAYRNSANKVRTVLGKWITDEEAELNDVDEVGLEGGWYECIDNWDDYTTVAIHEGEPTHWMPLPAPPGAHNNQQTEGT